MSRYIRVGDHVPPLNQPCILKKDDTNWFVTEVYWDPDLQINMVGVTPWAGNRQSLMRINDWYRLYRVPDAPEAS